MSDPVADPNTHGRPDAAALLNDAEQLCRQRGLRWTPLRRRVLEIILAGTAPIGAYQILEVLGRETGRAAPPTVYRALDFLLEQGLIHKVEGLSAFTVCPHPDDRHRAQFLICRQCGEVVELSDAAIQSALGRAARAQGFAVESETVEITGRCQRCRQA